MKQPIDKRRFIPNQIFVGLPWKNTKPRYERVIHRLEKKYPLHFVIIGRDEGQDAEDLFGIIKLKIQSSSYAVFDATGGNPNVALEYGYAEGISVPRAIYINQHKATQRPSSLTPIISDLGGKRRIQYKTERSLSLELNKLCKNHDYTKRFEKALTKIAARKSRGQKKSTRTLAIKAIRCFDGLDKIRRAELVQKRQANNYKEKQIDEVLKKMHVLGIIKCSVGRFSDVVIA